LEGKIGHDQDIASYVGSKFDVPSGAQAEIIKDRILSRASGIFLWVVLVVRILNDAYDAGRTHALQGLLEEIPNELDELFANILTRDFKTRNESILCLQWLLFAQRPLRREELYFAILSGTEPAILREWGHAEVTDETIDKYILNCSKGLAEVSKAKDQTVQFIHESVRDFLLLGNGLASLLQPEPAYDITGLSHERLKDCCYQYITADIFPFQIDLCVTLPHAKSRKASRLRHETSTKFPFIEYATENMFNHANIAQGYNVLQRDFLQSFECASPTGQTSRTRWIAFHNTLQRHQIRRYTPTAEFLYIFAEKGFQNLVQVLLDGKSNVDATGERYGNALQAASTNGYTAIIQLLIDAGANVNIRGGEYGCPIAAAISRNHKPIVELLLDNAADPTAGRNLATNLLIQSVKNGDEAIFRRLFFANPKVDLNTRDDSGRTALAWAILKRYDTIASQLLTNSEVNPNIIINGYSEAALFLAVLQDNNTIFSQLLAHPRFLPNIQDDSGKTLLVHATLGRMGTIVSQLLANPEIDPDIRDFAGRTALSYAFSKGGYDMAKRLLANPKVSRDY
jgi:ankyrin repeat protein